MGDMTKQKKLRTISIGTSDVHVNDVGTPYLHKRHKVGIAKFEKGRAGRAVVFDQHLIDVLYTEKHLTEQQHNACDKYLGVLSKGMHMTNPSFGDRITTGRYYLAPVPKSCILIKVQRHIRQSCGRKIENRFWVLMSGDKKEASNLEIKLIQTCADSVLSFYYISLENPASLFQQALLNPIS